MSLTKLLLFASLIPLNLIGQILPAVNTLTSNGIICTFTVIDSNSSVATDCVQASDGTILVKSVHAPHIKGSILGTGPILCLLSKSTAAPITVNLQCTVDDDTIGPKLTINGTLPSVTKLRKWTIFWN